MRSLARLKSVPAKMHIVEPVYAFQCYRCSLFSSDFLFIRTGGVPSIRPGKSQNIKYVTLSWTIKNTPG